MNEEDGVPTGTMNAEAFRAWLLDGRSATGPDVGKLATENVWQHVLIGVCMY